MKQNLRKILMVITAAAVSVTVPLARAANAEGIQSVTAPWPPHVDFATIPAGRLQLGMTAADVTRIMGEPAKVKSYVAGETEMTKLEFPAGPIPSQVTLADGKVSAVKLDVFQVEKGDLPSFVRQAWPGMSGSGVRRALGEPNAVRHYTFFDFKLDQLVFRHPGEGEVSVFLVADRVVAKAAGQDIPAGIFHIALPAPQPADKASTQGPQVGMGESKVAPFYGAVKFRVDYVFNGQPALRTIVETHAAGSFASLTFVDGILTEFEDLGRLPEEVFRGL
jgi:hypothetical protein